MFPPLYAMKFKVLPWILLASNVGGKLAMNKGRCQQFVFSPAGKTIVMPIKLQSLTNDTGEVYDKEVQLVDSSRPTGIFYMSL